MSVEAIARAQQHALKRISMLPKPDEVRFQQYNLSRMKNIYQIEKLEKMLQGSRFIMCFDRDSSVDPLSLRARLSEFGCKTIPIKNSLLRWKLKETKHSLLADYFRGPSVIIAHDPERKEFELDRWGISLVKKIAAALDKQKDLMYIAGVLDSSVVSRAEMMDIVKGKPIEHELAVTISKFPMYALPKNLSAGKLELSRILSEREKQLGGESD
jgi:ribosomal protein L10